MSKLIQIPIAGASEKELRDFAAMQQYDITGVAAGDVGSLLAIIQTAWQGDMIFTQESPATGPISQETPVSIVAEQKLTGGTGADDPKVIIKVGATPYPGGGDPIPLGHNGHTVVLQRNMLTELPYRYYIGPLSDAVRGDVAPGPDDALGRPGPMMETEYSNYPIIHCVLPSDEEIAAWHERTDNELMPA